MKTITEHIVQGRMTKLTPELETGVYTTGKTFESVTLGLGDTTLSREVRDDGSRGEITISTQEFGDFLGSNVAYQNYILSDGKLMPDNRFGERFVGKLRKAQLLSKIAFGRVNHWDKESDFYGTIEEEE